MAAEGHGAITSIAGPATAADVVDRVNSLVPVLHSRAVATEKMRRIHPDNLRDLTHAGVFRLPVPADVGGYQADEDTLAEVLAQIARGCPSSGWICAVMLASNVIPAMLADEAADEIYATPDLRITAAFAPTGQAAPVSGGYRVSGRWQWNSGGIHGNWFIASCMTPTDGGPVHLVALLPRASLLYQDNWRASGMSGTATNTVVASDVFVPTARAILVKDLAEGRYPERRYSDDPYYNRPWLMYINAMSAPTLLGIARGAMDSFMRTLPTRGAIAYTSWSKAAEAPVLHHQLAKAQLALESAEMFAARLSGIYCDARHTRPSMRKRVQARVWMGHVATLARDCVNHLFEASSASETLLAADMQRYFRDVNVLHQHAAIQPNSSNELYGRFLAGLESDSAVV
jgi:3-hydroxy-9,10-secoandrosta-1,3,5(10)-triene-9,17-dione monooxygenase